MGWDSNRSGNNNNYNNSRNNRYRSSNNNNRGPRRSGNDKIGIGALWPTKSDTVHNGVLELFGRDPESNDKIKDIVAEALDKDLSIRIALFERQDQSGGKPKFWIAVDPEEPYAKK